MGDSEKVKEEGDARRNDSAPGEGGDVVEQAGETTAAALITGPADTRAVGEGTRVKVAGEDESSGVANDAGSD